MAVDSHSPSSPHPKPTLGECENHFHLSHTSTLGLRPAHPQVLRPLLLQAAGGKPHEVFCLLPLPTTPQAASTKNCKIRREKKEPQSLTPYLVISPYFCFFPGHWATFSRTLLERQYPRPFWLGRETLALRDHSTITCKHSWPRRSVFKIQKKILIIYKSPSRSINLPLAFEEKLLPNENK